MPFCHLTIFAKYLFLCYLTNFPKKDIDLVSDLTRADRNQKKQNNKKLIGGQNNVTNDQKQQLFPVST